MGEVIQGPWKKLSGFEKRTILEMIEHELLIIQNIDKREEPAVPQPPRWSASASHSEAPRR